MLNSESENDVPRKKRIKGIVNASAYKRNIIKTSRVKGKEYVSHSGKQVPVVKTGDDCYFFGCPQVDVCSTCESLSVKLKDPLLCDNSKKAVVAEMMVHKQKARKFYTAMKDVQENQNETVAILRFDYMQNLPLPAIPKRIRKIDKIYTPEKYVNEIIAASARRHFSVKDVKTKEILSYKKWWPKKFKRSSMSDQLVSGGLRRQKRIPFKIS
ncbi:hypothetical protein ILUMI_21309 [Ignelater luminosus]|uniref:Uncharacterized protein n=1 Tax=Ignelater luminosus TaxID=2038154 RepID=A0A8K0G3T8_IGNLU|nr:hypothetical protein ILUMI_21309 [Ignelater luminosus]